MGSFRCNSRGPYRRHWFPAAATRPKGIRTEFWVTLAALHSQVHSRRTRRWQVGRCDFAWCGRALADYDAW